MGSFEEISWKRVAGHQVLGCKWMDAVNAFVNCPLEEEEIVFMRMPPGFQKPGKVLRLRKALYELGFKKVPQEPCVMMKGAVTVFSTWTT
ncbi:reverse transcriptase (RNA-dependent DNA polymerase) domain-containing protein [Hirsutella rhossiliensis]|uniref:Reverse transcriptase (RNA-dependent DNA polymerase) domain-containing protein n=1 Tax=Hirsutella rhossiliensis TaxID=111463 RepID=A0A9P8MLG7_9HYPO|nr:reverse transcriptase (RNA-dependent DNA polymerase) domain-containing protein [Hirsutella rhossiliensis]KAH0957512.1 reverse transcriptase (RNA-dependent DNA polymerase) domain-containing protein [Hirsutella rhossiliensis]